MTALVLQCGGPTAVVNTTLAALVERWRAVVPAGTLHGGRYGLAALLGGDWLPLAEPGTHATPGMSGSSSGMLLGGGRTRLGGGEIEAAVGRLAARRVDTLFLIGGNGTMAAGRALAERAAASRTPLRVFGVPKTIDNDIPGTDVCPGFPSAARFLVEAVGDIAADTASMRGYEDVVLIEVMGRHTGWLAAATLLARARPARGCGPAPGGSAADDAPHLVLVPEQPVDADRFLDAVRAQHARAGLCVATVAEGVRDRAGVFLAEHGAESAVERDPSGQVILGRSGGPLPYLARLVRDRLGLRCRLVRPDVLQRCSRAHVTALDRTLAAMAAAAAVDLASGGATMPAMVALRQRPEGWTTEAVPLEAVRGERSLPPDILSDPAPLRNLLD